MRKIKKRPTKTFQQILTLAHKRKSGKNLEDQEMVDLAKKEFLQKFKES